MSLTPEQRSAINQANASKSTGPKSESGRARSRANSLRHGLRAEILALPDEDPTVVTARAEAWNEYYQPQSPAAQHLVNQCIQATLLADRCNRYHAAALSAQVRNAPVRREASCEDKLRRHVRKLHSYAPAAATRKLWGTARGCRWMIERWTLLAEVFERKPGWDDEQLDEALRLLGNSPTAWETNPEVYRLKLYNLLGQGAAAAHLVSELLKPSEIPWELAGVYEAGSLPTSEYCRRHIAAVIADVLTRLKETEALLREEVEKPEDDLVTDRAAILTDPAEAQLFLRYQAEARTLFHRSYNELVRTLKRDESGPYPAEAVGAQEPFTVDEPGCDSLFTSTCEEPPDLEPVAPEPVAAAVSQEAAAEPVAAVSPNEANPAAGAAPAGAFVANSGVANGQKPVQATVKFDPNGSPGRVDERRRMV